jgi:hypothetical protein
MRSRLLALLVLFSLLPFLTGATIVIRGPRAPAAGGGSPSLIDSVATGGTANTVTSGSINTTGANLLIVSVSWYPAGGADVTTVELSDSKGNTWTQLNLAGTIGVTFTANRLFYCYSGTVGTGHTFTVTETGSYPAIAVMAFSNAASSPLDQQSQAETPLVTTVQPGSITATQADAILVTSCAWDVDTTTASVNLSFTGTVSVAATSGNHVGGGLAYRIDTSATATNPTWTKTGGISSMSASVASFKY